MQQGNVILSTAYFPPIQYLTKFLIYSKIEIEKFENYTKQSFRNRCIIMGANGALTLSIPVKKDFHPHIPIAELKIDYQTNWQKIHWKAIEAAYRRSPFFEFYKDDFYPFFHGNYEFLLPFNSQILDIVLLRLGIEKIVKFSEKYEPIPDGYFDFRDTIHPKPAKSMEDDQFSPAKYNQVFLNKFDFVPNLTILDLLFNEGPNSLSILKESICEK